MKAIVHNEEPFKVLNSSVTIGFSTSGYTLAYSANGSQFTNYTEATPANEVLIVNGLTRYSWLKLVGNSGDVEVTL